MEDYCNVFRQSLVSDNPLLSQVLDVISQRSGKMMRPILTILSAKLCGEVNDKTLYAAATYEFFHTASLVHDDVVDESDERRGQSAVHSEYGNKVAVLVGDYMLATAIGNAAKSQIPQIVGIVSQAAGRLASGEILQLSNVQDNDYGYDVYYRIIKDKTAALFAACAETGAISAGADDATVEKLRRFGEIIGICFQIRDDIFDYFADKKSIGKPTGNDMKEGKLTLPVLYVLNEKGDEHYRQIAARVKSGDVTQEEIADIVAYTKAQGGIEYARQCMFDFADEAKAILDAFGDSDAKDSLLRYVDFVVDRNS